MDDERSPRLEFDPTRAGQVCTAAALKGLAKRLERAIGPHEDWPCDVMSSAYSPAHMSRPFGHQEL